MTGSKAHLISIFAFQKLNVLKAEFLAMERRNVFSLIGFVMELMIAEITPMKPTVQVVKILYCSYLKNIKITALLFALYNQLINCSLNIFGGGREFFLSYNLDFNLIVRLTATYF